MADAEKKFRLIYFDHDQKKWLVLEFSSVQALLDWRNKHVGAILIRFIVGHPSGNVSYDTLEEAISAAKGDKTLVKPKVPDDLPQEAIQMLYNLI
jgi:hypothetical protein